MSKMLRIVFIVGIFTALMRLSGLIVFHCSLWYYESSCLSDMYSEDYHLRQCTNNKWLSGHPECVLKADDGQIAGHLAVSFICIHHGKLFTSLNIIVLAWYQTLRHISPPFSAPTDVPMQYFNFRITDNF